MIGYNDPRSIEGKLTQVTIYALNIFRDLLDATIRAKAGIYKDVLSSEDDNLLEATGVNWHIEHAEHELKMLRIFLKNVKERLPCNPLEQ